MKEVEGTGKNLEQAIENALFELKAPREDVDIKIISEGGLFKKAKVLVKISDDCINKYEKKEEKRKSFIEDEDGLCIKKTPVEEIKEEKKIAKEIKKEEKKAVKEEEKSEKKADKKERIEKNIDPKTFLENFFKNAGKEVEITEKEDDRNITYAITGENLSEFIGYRGETLFAISFLTSILAGRTEKRVLVDVGGYRDKRVETLKSLAERTAHKVEKTGRYVKLEPMDPSERRIIHMALQDNSKVTTISKGTEPHRYVMIFPVEYQERR